MDVMWFVYALIFLVALVQTPVLVDLLRFMFPKWRVTRLTNRASSFLLMLTMTSIAFIALGYYFTFLHLVAEDPWHSAVGICHIVFAGWVFFNMAVNYAMAVFVDPGVVVRGDAQKVSEVNAKTDDDSRTEREGNAGEHTSTDDANSSDIHAPSRKNKSEAMPLPKSGMEWKLKPFSFCKVCRNEVLHLDHHCPFTGSCIGIRNYSYFFLCMVYGSIGLGYGLLLTLPFFIQCKLSRPLWYFGLAAADQTESDVCKYLQHHLFLTGPLAGGFFVTTSLLLIQVFLLLSDLTTYSVLKNFSRLPVLRFAWERIRSGKFKDADSRLNLLLLRQRSSFLWLLIPVRNSVD